MADNRGDHEIVALAELKTEHFAGALRALRSGARATRRKWGGIAWLSIEQASPPYIVCVMAYGVLPWVPVAEDLLADDWICEGK
jgi:hypothetical protein